MTALSNMTMDLDGSSMLITGAGFDIGKALALRCAQHGAQVILMDSDLRALNAVYDQIMAEKLPEPIILKLHADELKDEVAALIRDQIMSEHGKLDALIHTANTAFALTPTHLIEDEVFNRAFNVLHTHPHRITRELYVALQAAKRPSIIFTSHFSAHANKPFWGTHTAAFSALEALTRQWAVDTQNLGFSVNSIDPGIVDTSVRRKHYPAENHQQLCKPDDEPVMSLYLNLLSEAGKIRTGEHFVLDVAC